MVARLGNVYGHGAAKDSVAAIILRQVLDGGPIVLNSLSPVRDFIYRDDVVSGLIALATLTSVDGHQVFNLSSGVPTSIRDVAETAAAVAGVRQEPIERFPDTSAGQDRVVLAIDRLRKATSWTPSFSLETGLRASLVEAGFVQ
jgi:nucleoside-diphosphate-sugar epimerase